jgi:hypothetical protein
MDAGGQADDHRPDGGAFRHYSGHYAE